MDKKLIFLRNGQQDFNVVYKYIPSNYKEPWDILNGNYELRPELGLEGMPYDIDECIREKGYVNAVEYLHGMLNNIYTTTCPAILSAHDENFDPMWWNEEEHKWEIYFIEDYMLKNISEFTTRELRAAHNIERLYLNGGLDG